MSEISREHEHLVQDTLADKIRRETDAAKIALLRESLVGKDATTVLPPKYKGWKSEYPVYMRKEAGSTEDINGIKPDAQLTILDVAKETSDTKRGNGKSESHIWYKVEVTNPDDLNTKAYGNDNVGWVSAEFLHADTSHIDTASEDPKPGNGDPKPGNGDPKPGNGDPKPGNGDPKPGNGDPKPGNGDPKAGTGGTETGGRTVSVVGGGKNETFVDPPRAEGTVQVFDEKSVLENLAQDVNVQKRLPKFLLVSQVANTFIQGLRANPSSHGNKPEQAERLEQKIGAIMKELSKLGSKLNTEVPDYTKVQDKLLSLEKDMGPIFGEDEVREMIQHLDMVQNEIPLVTNGDAQAPGEVPEWIERKIGSNMRKYILGANGNSGLAMEFMSNRLIKRRDVAGTNPKMEQLRAELRNADSAIFNMLETKGWSAVNDYLYNTLKSIGVSDSANDTFRKEAKKAVDSINQQYNDNAPALKASFKQELLAKGVPNDANLDGKVLVLFEAKKNDAVSKAVTSQLTTKAIRHKADSDNDANDGQLIAEIDSASEDGWVLIGSQIAVDIGTILATGGVAGALGKLAARGVAAAVEYSTLAARAARVGRGIVLGTELATSGGIIGGALQIEHNAFDHRDVFADILPAAGWGAAFGVVNGVISTLGNSVLQGGIARVSGLGAGPSGRLAAGAVAPWSEESFRAMWALSRSNALSRGINVAAWGAREAAIVYASMGVIEYAQSKSSDREWHGMTLEEFGPALVMHFVLKNYGDKGPYERAQQKVRDLHKEIQALKGSDNAAAYESQINALQKAHDYMSKQLEVTDHLNTIPNPPITTKPEDQKAPETSPFMSAKERMTHVKPGETVVITGKDGSTMEITVKTNNNGILEGTAKSTEADGTMNPEIPVKMNIRSDGLLVVKNMDGTPYKGLVIKKLSDIAEMEVQPAGTKTKSPEITPISELQTKLAALEKQYKTLKESGREGQRDREELIRFNDEINAVKRQIVEQQPKTKEKPVVTPKEKFTTAEKTADHGKMRDLEGQVRGINEQIAAAERLGNKTTRTRELIRLHEQKTALVKELDGIRNKYEIPTYEKAPNLATNTTLSEFSVGVEKIVPTRKTQEKPKTEENTTPKEKTAELTELQRLQKENAEANTEFDRLVNSTEKVDPKTLEAARERKRETAAALEKHLSSETTTKPRETETTKTESTKPKLTPEQIKKSKELGDKIKKFTRGEGPYAKVLGDNGPNHMDIGGGLQITRHVEGGKFGLGRKETFSIEAKGSKPGEKFKAEELTSKLSPEQQSQLTKVMDSIARAEVHSRGNTTETSWVIDGVTHVKVVQTGFASDKVQTFEGTRSGDVYNGTLTRNDGRVLTGNFKIQATADRGHLDMVNA